MTTATTIKSGFSLARIVEESRETLHICATCVHKQRVNITTEDGQQRAAIWRCRIMTARFEQEVIVEALGSCRDIEAHSDFWTEAVPSNLLW